MIIYSLLSDNIFINCLNKVRVNEMFKKVKEGMSDD